MKIVLIGKNGQLGWEFQHILPSLGEVISLGRAELDVSEPQTIQKTLLELRPNLIINTSAYTEVDQAETQTELATKVNATAPGVMSEIARILGAILIHYSTDYVFDGKNKIPYTENDLAQPLNIYGKSKLMGEENIKQSGAAYLIFRTSWVYSLRGNSFVNKVLGWSRKNKNLKIVRDQVSCPTWARMLAETTSRAIATHQTDLLENIHGRSGIYHLAGGGFTSRYEWAQHILANDSKPTEQLIQTIEPALSVDFPTPATRPLFSALNCSKFENTFDIRLPAWQTSLQQAMRE